MSEYITFNGKKSTDFDAIIMKDGIDIAQPEQNVIEASVPFMDGNYDFSAINGGLPTYKKREITFDFYLSAKNENDLYWKKCDIVRWLNSTRGGTLRISCLKDYKFLNATAFIDNSAFKFISKKSATFQVKFKADPYMQTDDYSDIPFDDYNLNIDCFNPNGDFITFTAGVGQVVHVYLYHDAPIHPTLWVGGECSYRAVINGKTIGINLPKGYSTNIDFILNPGDNVIELEAGSSYTLLMYLYERML